MHGMQGRRNVHPRRQTGTGLALLTGAKGYATFVRGEAPEARRPPQLTLFARRCCPLADPPRPTGNMSHFLAPQTPLLQGSCPFLYCDLVLRPPRIGRERADCRLQAPRSVLVSGLG